MTRTDPAYDYFREDAERFIGNPKSLISSVADYFRALGIVPPAPYGRPPYKDREVTVGLEDSMEKLIAGDRPVIDKSWGEPGRPIVWRGGRSDDGV